MNYQTKLSMNTYNVYSCLEHRASGIPPYKVGASDDLAAVVFVGGIEDGKSKVTGYNKRIAAMLKSRHIRRPREQDKNNGD